VTRQTAAVIVDCAVYRDGTRLGGSIQFADALEAARSEGAFVWIGVHEPTGAEFEDVAKAFHLHPLAVEDALKAHQRPKLEVHDDTLFVVLKTARYLDETETVELGEIQLFVGPHFVVAIRHGNPSELRGLRRALESDPEMLALGPALVLHAVCDRVVDEYFPVVDGILDDIQEVERDVFSEERTNPAQRIYELKREVLELTRNTEPLVDVLSTLVSGRVEQVPDDLTHYFRDVHDHLLRVVGRLGTYGNLLSDALEANLAQVSVRQNEDMRTISSWAAIIGVPTMLAGIWGMNFRRMPELDWVIGYPVALATIVLSSFLVYRRLKRAGWL
jgi:magnesium transporter